MELGKVLVVGLGKSGIAAAETLVSLKAQVSVYDKKTEEACEPQLLHLLENQHVTFYLGTEPEQMSQFDLLVVSPGVPLTESIVTRARDAGVEIIGEIELAYRLGKGNYVAITGTNGKTTTTVLTGEIFKNAGKKTEVVGNVGVAVVGKAIESEESTWLVTEISSFQLETTKQFRPKVSAVLNITPDHMDRHLTMENYAAAKAMIFQNQTKEDFFVVNYDEPIAWKLAEHCPATVVPFSRKHELPFGCYLLEDDLVVRNAAGEVIRFCKKEELIIPGAHNLENALAAVGIAYFAGIDPAVITKTLQNFGGVEHRLEFSGEIGGIRFVNDSKGTNPDASIKAIEAMKGEIVLIAGGYDKNSEYDELMEAAKGKVKAFVLLGKTAPKIKAAAEKAGFTNIYMAKDMEECVREGYRKAAPGDTVLLSPACASWDMYKCFEQRGEHFKACVRNLEK